MSGPEFRPELDILLQALTTTANTLTEHSPRLAARLRGHQQPDRRTQSDAKGNAYQETHDGPPFLLQKRTLEVRPDASTHEGRAVKRYVE